MDTENTLTQPDSPGPDRFLLTTCTVLGAVLIHLVAALLAFVKGAILGAGGGPVPMAPTPIYREVQYGFGGGVEGVSELGMIYLFTYGIVPLIVSVIGGIVGFKLARRAEKFTHINSHLSNDANSLDRSYKKVTAIWAASLYIAEFCLSWLLIRFRLIGWENLQAMLSGIHLGVWTIGSVAAYVRHRDWQIPVVLTVIAVLISLVSFWLSPYSLLVTSIGILIYSTTSWNVRISDDYSSLELEKSHPVHDRVDGLTMFVLGGITFYMLVCQFVFLHMLSESRGSENWGLGMLLILGFWGIPVFGGIALLLRNTASQLPWLTTRNAWLIVGFEVCVCAFVWLFLFLFVYFG